MQTVANTDIQENSVLRNKRNANSKANALYAERKNTLQKTVSAGKGKQIQNQNTSDSSLMRKAISRETSLREKNTKKRAFLGVATAKVTPSTATQA